MQFLCLQSLQKPKLSPLGFFLSTGGQAIASSTLEDVVRCVLSVSPPRPPISPCPTRSVRSFSFFSLITANTQFILYDDGM